MELVWLRSDLRVHDHAPLSEALETDTPVMAGYLFNRRRQELTEAGFAREDTKRHKFLIESLLEIHQQLSQIGVPLMLAEGEAGQEAADWIDRFHVTRIHAYTYPGTEEQVDEKAVAEAAEQAGIPVIWYEGDTLLHTEDLPFAISELPKGFSGFRKKVEKQDILPREEAAAPKEQQPLYLEEHAASGEKLMEAFRSLDVQTFVNGGEQEGLRRLQAYLFESRDILDYKERRNGMLVFNDSSKLSPWLASGSLSPRRVYWELKRFEEEVHANDSTYWLFFELLWRDFFHLLMRKKGRDMFLAEGLQQLPIEWKLDKELFQAWCDGMTGYPLIDASMRQLKECGFMSNRGRQNTASFLTKNLGIDWRWGAAWFEAHLLDHDVASNYGNWQYVAGVGSDAKEFRAFHVVNQGKRYDSKGDFVRFFLPELNYVPNKYIYEPFKLDERGLKEAAVELGQTYPFPIVDLDASLEERKQAFHQARSQKKERVSR
ncbi:cryptochrome/photolyase family protein [Alkalicoccus luteus]|uniref:Cryptochrome DASH n=1 Tax=Alkalicoccus luteus TaxID=1237094 RepID=A0A969PZC5_9BACI|nr:DASH family cryptochrome [Alkalicoccus luteus]NJP38327.1 DASH family cryptochrome [Alkalicoccus luteus]